MTIAVVEKSVGELAAEYDAYTLDAIASVIRSARAEGMSVYDVYEKVSSVIKIKYPRMRYLEDDLESDLIRLLMDQRVSMFAGRYFNKM